MRRKPRPKPAGLFAASVLALASAARADGINLSQFQEIAGFPINCENAYNVPVPGCTQADFSPPDAPCSQACFAGLQTVTDGINSACGGLSADPSTLVGLFFEGKGAQALCPSVSNAGDEGSDSGAAATTIVGATTLPPSQPSVIILPPSLPPPSGAPTTVAAVSVIAPAPSTAPVVSETFVLSSAGASMTTTIQPFTASAGATSVSVAVAGTETSSGSQTAGAASFGGGAIPFTVNNSSSGALALSASRGLLASAAAALAACAVAVLA